MSNDLIQKKSGELITTSQQAEKIYNIDNIQNFQHTSQIFMTGGLPGMPNAALKPITFSRDYYNLIIYGQEPFTGDGHITFEKRRCLVEDANIEPELKARFSPLTPEIIEELKTFPCIVSCENNHYGWADEDQYAAVAQLTDIKNRSNGIELYFRLVFGIPQAKISALLFELGICGKPGVFNELNHSHWTVKGIDLMEVLTDAGLNPFGR